jgi:hypothetical protein
MVSSALMRQLRQHPSAPSAPSAGQHRLRACPGFSGFHNPGGASSITVPTVLTVLRG